MDFPHEDLSPVKRAFNTAANAAAGERKPRRTRSGTLRMCREPRTTCTSMLDSRYSETGMNCLIQLPKLPGLRL